MQLARLFKPFYRCALLLLSLLAQQGCQQRENFQELSVATESHLHEHRQIDRLPIAELALLYEHYRDKLTSVQTRLETDFQDWRWPDALREEKQPLWKALLLGLSTEASLGQRLALGLQLEASGSISPEQSLAYYRQLAATALDIDAALADLLDFHVGRSAQTLAELEKANALAPSEKLALARAAYHKVLERRDSPHYHAAQEGLMRLKILDGSLSTEELEAFLAHYPDYPAQARLRLDFAKLALNRNERERAEQSLQTLVFDLPWTQEAREAEALLAREGFAWPERSAKEELARIDLLRRRRFWREAERAAESALLKAPNDGELLLQRARIAYEQSRYSESLPYLERLESLALSMINKQVAGSERLRYQAQSYLATAMAYQGQCEAGQAHLQKAIAQMGKAEQRQRRFQFAKSCGQLKEAYRLAQQLDWKIQDPEALEERAFLAYLAKDYEQARYDYAQALRLGLGGNKARRSAYFSAQATLKSAQAAERQAQAALLTQLSERLTEAFHASTQNLEKNLEGTDINKQNKTKPPKNKAPAQLGLKTTKAKTQTSRKGLAPLTLPKASQALARTQFQALLDNQQRDYYAILAFSRLAELQNDAEKMANTPMLQDMQLTPERAAVAEQQQSWPWQKTFFFDKTQVEAKLNHFIEHYGKLFPDIARVKVLHDSRQFKARNAAFRVIALEVMGILSLNRRPTTRELWTRKLSIDGHLVDNRRLKRGVWGCPLLAWHFVLPELKDNQARQTLAKRQADIYDAGQSLKTASIDLLIAFEDYYLARRYAGKSQQACEQGRERETCSIMYPHAYNQAIYRESLALGFNPELMWTIMNIESAFNHDSISHADAYGLLQVIPMTGYKVAEALEISPFGPYHLIEAERSIPMGTWYFSQILHKFQGYASLAMAAYNAGPHYLARWLTAYAGQVEHDAFVELIPFNEARAYIKKGSERLLIYRRLGTGDQSFYYMPNTLPNTFLEMPNY